MRYYNFEIIITETREVKYSSRTISAIKRYISKHNLPIDLGSTGLSIRCCHTEKPIIVSFADFYNKTNPSKEIMQQEFSSEIREFRKIGGAKWN